MIGQPQWQAQRGKQGVHIGRRQRIAQPLPGVPLISRQLVPLHGGKRLLPAKLTAEKLAAEHEVRSRVDASTSAGASVQRS